MDVLNELQRKEAYDKVVSTIKKLEASKNPVDYYISRKYSKCLSEKPLCEGNGPEAEYKCPLCHSDLYGYINWDNDKFCQECGQKIKMRKHWNGFRSESYLL